MADPRRTESGRPPGRSFLRRQAPTILATTVLVTVGAWGYASAQTPTYTAQAQVLIEPLTLPTAVVRTPDMGTEQAVATSSAVLTGAAKALGLSLGAVHGAVSVGVPVNADVLDIGYSSPDPTAARDGATAVAQSYMDYRARTNSRLAGPGVTSTLAAPGVQTHLVTPAARPAHPSAPDFVVDVLAGIVVGLIAGSALAFVLDRYGERMRTLIRWQEVTGIPVLVGLPRDGMVDATAGLGGVRGSHVLRYLRVRVAHALPARGAVLLVTEVREQPERRAVASFLVSALLDTGSSAVLIEMTRDQVNQPESAEATYPGDLRVRVTVSPGPGSPLPPAGEWYSTTVTELLRVIERHRADCDVVVVTAPPVTTSATALDVAAIADAALVIDHVATARRKPALRALDEIRSTGCRVCGAVLLGLRTARTGNAATPAAAAAGDASSRGRQPAARRVTTAALTYIDGSARPTSTRHDVANGSRT